MDDATPIMTAHRRTTTAPVCRARVSGPWGTLVVVLVAACGSQPPRAWAPPETLADTGFASLAKRPFAPQYPLWTDGAVKARFIALPPGAQIDGSDPDAWEFPVGTRLWKQFVFGGVLAETRYIERTPSGWYYRAFPASPVEVAPGVPHVVPRDRDCPICHTSGPLGFSTLQLSADRDPGAAHRESPPAGAVDLAELVETGALRGYRGPTAPRIAGTPTARAALGYLRGNCGGCHSARTPLESLDMELAWSSVHGSERTLASVVGRPSRIVADRDREHVIAERMRSREPVMQMPPLGTRLVDRAGLELVSAWIAELSQVSQLERTRTTP